MIRKILVPLLLGILALPTPHPAVAQDMVIPVTVISDTLTRYRMVLEEKGLPAEDITELKSRHADRQVADLVILKQALAAGGLPVTFDFIEVPNAARERESVRSGAAVLAAEDLFSIAFTDDVHMSLPVVPWGNFVKGVYGLADNDALHKVRSLNELKRLSAVSSSEWKLDWRTLQEIDPKRLVSVARHQTMFKVIQYRDIDFTLYEFPSTPDLSQTVDGIRLVPVHGVKVMLRDSRHFMVSKRHPDGNQVYEALQYGLTQLYLDGTIERFFTDVGFYNPAVKDWPVLNP